MIILDMLFSVWREKDIKECSKMDAEKGSENGKFIEKIKVNGK